MASSRALAGGIVAICIAAVAAALVSQHVFGMLPCPWCVLQRLIFLAIALVALPAVFTGGPVVRRTSALLVIALALSGIAAALWQHLVAASSASCNLTLADRIVQATKLDQLLPSVFVPWASCADAAVKLFGIWYEYYSLALYALLAGIAIAMLRRRAR